MHRRHHLAAGIAGAGLLASLTPPASAATAEMDIRALAGVWLAAFPSRSLIPSDGRGIPFTPQGMSRYEASKAGLKAGTLVDEAKRICVPEGMPRAMAGAYPLQIIVGHDQITIAHEANRAFRSIRLAQTHADPTIWDPAYMGEPIAQWGGDVLTIDSTNFKADNIFLDETGVPASERLHLVEQVRLIDGGRRLEDQITIDDPVMFTRPWTVRLQFDRRDDLQLRTDWVCGEPHRDLSAIKSSPAK